VLLIAAVVAWLLAVAVLVGVCQSAKQGDRAQRSTWDAEASSRQFVRKTWQP
jgi:hypothetical protein